MALSSKEKEFRAALSIEILSLMESRMPPVSTTVIEILRELIDERIRQRIGDADGNSAKHVEEGRSAPENAGATEV